MVFWKGIIVLAFVLSSFLFVNKSYATPACGGTISCYPTYDLCTNAAGDICIPGGVEVCTCSAVCDGENGHNAVQYSCQGFSASLCTDPSFGATFCNTQCAGFGGQGALAFKRLLSNTRCVSGGK